jgi:hypothetical protein
MKISTIAIVLTVAMLAPAAAHERGAAMLKDAAVNHDLEKAKRQLEKALGKSGVLARAPQDR